MISINQGYGKRKTITRKAMTDFINNLIVVIKWF